MACTSVKLVAQTAFTGAQKYHPGSKDNLPLSDNEFNNGSAAKAVLPNLLKAVFNTRWKEESVLLTVDAAWSGESLLIFYNYYRGANVLSLEDDQLIEKIIFTIRPEQIDALDTEDDEFLFLYLRSSSKSTGIHSRLYRPASGEKENNQVSSVGFPVRRDNLPEIIQALKAIRSPGKS